MQRFTIYDVMEKNGVFRTNPANAGAQSEDGTVLYSGPVEFPKMLYHPEGKERVLVPAEIISTPMGPKYSAEQRELVHVLVQNALEESRLLAEGWHQHPSDAISVRTGLPGPAKGMGDMVKLQAKSLADQAAEIEALKAKIKELEEA